MNRVASIRTLAAAALMGGVFAASGAAAAPSATIHFSGGSVAFLASINWGGGALHFHGRSFPLRVSGLGVGAIGADKFEAEGEVYHLRRASDIEGTYSAVNASATGKFSSASVFRFSLTLLSFAASCRIWSAGIEDAAFLKRGWTPDPAVLSPGP